MSDQPTPYEPSSAQPVLPPLAQQQAPQAYGSWPAPLAPLPVQSLSYGYSTPGTGRPGILTAVAVISIVLASLSLLGNLWGGLFSIGMYAVSQVRVPTASSTVVSPPSGAVFSQSVVVNNSAGSAQPQPAQQELPVTLAVGPRGMEEAERRIVIGGLQQARGGMEPLTQPRVKMLDALLADSGQDMFAFRGPALTYANISSNVSDVGQLPSVSKDRPGADYYVIGSGRMEIYDDHALFAPSGGGDVVRVSDEDLAVSVAGGGLTPKDVQAVVNRIQTMSGQPLSPAHLKTLRSLLNSPSQGLITPRKPGGVPPDQQVTQVMLNNGNLNVFTINGGLMLSPKGTVTNSWSIAGAGFGGPAAAPFKIPAGAALMTVLESLASLLLAIFLLVCGILTLRQNRFGRRGHLIYAALKIPLVILGAIGWAWLFYSMTSTISGTGAGSPQASLVSILQAGGYLLIGLIYPTALLIVFTRRKVREYYNPAGG